MATTDDDDADHRQPDGPRALRAPGPDLERLPEPALPGPGIDDTELRIRAVLDELRRSGAPSDALEALGEVLGTLRSGAAPTAAFVGADGRTRMFALPGAEFEDQAHCGAVPHILPLLHWRQQHPAYATVMLDRTGAELVVQPAGAAEPVRAAITGPDDEIERNAPGGSAQPRYQRRAEDSWQHNAGRVAEAVAEALAAARAKLLIVGGDVRAEQYFLDRLPVSVHSEVAIKSIPGGRAPTARSTSAPTRSRRPSASSWTRRACARWNASRTGPAPAAWACRAPPPRSTRWPGPRSRCCC
ncbi:Vms1/Ankzf1 family peptidyl-tRNA hydrolase [Catenulispora yoronensis]